jgi:endonuclease/exonuclease/phosphatase (EEP) superfamily protein YafD
VTGYPGRIEAPRDDNFGVALYARGELRGAAEVLKTELPTVFAELALRGARLRIVLTHPPPPISARALAMQYVQLAEIAPRAAGAGPVVIMGDFNATPWSRPFAWLREHTGLCDSRAGFGIQASYPTESTLLRIPIDHLLASCTVGVRDRRIGRDVGSDHVPVLVDLIVPRSP